MRSADLLFLPMQKMPVGTRSGIVPGKTYEYLAAGRPILGAVPEGDTREILHAAGNAYVCEPDDVKAMARAIESELERRRVEGPAPFAVSPAVLERFERRAQALRYAELLDAVTNEPPREAATDPPAGSRRTPGEEAGFPAGR
jgi:glycosyltransferase involved in cell wall biosynthesis